MVDNSVKPTPTNVKDVYASIEAQVMQGKARGQRAEQTRSLIEAIAKEVGKTKLAASAVYQIVKTQLPAEPKFERSHFNNIVNKTWKTTKDEATGVVWIYVDQPIKKAA